MLRGITHAQQDFMLRAMTGANNVLLKDGNGIPSAMVRIPMFLMSDVIPGAPSTPHPMFIVNGQTVKEIYVGKYLANIYNGVPHSLPGRVPANNVSFADAIKATANKGDGWHVMTNAECAGLSLLAKSRGTMPSGNTNNGRSYTKTWESGILSDDAKGVAAGQKYECGYLYDHYLKVTNAKGSNIYRVMGDKTYPLYDWNTNPKALCVVVDTDRTAYVLNAGGVVDVFNIDVKTASYTIPDTKANTMVLDGTGNLWVMCSSGDLYEISAGAVSKVANIFTTADTGVMDMLFDDSGNIWISSNTNGALYKFAVATKTVTKCTGFDGVVNITFNPDGYVYAVTSNPNKLHRASLTNGGIVNSVDLPASPSKVVVDLFGNTYITPDRTANKNSLIKVDSSFNVTTLTVNEMTQINSMGLTVHNLLLLMGDSNKIVVYKNDSYYSEFSMGDTGADLPVTGISNNIGDSNGLEKIRVFGNYADRYYLNQKFVYKTGTVSGRMYPYNADTIHVSITGDKTFTGTYNHIEFDVSGSAFNKSYFNVTSTDIFVKANDMAAGNVLAELQTLTYSVAGENLVNIDGVKIGNVVKSKLTLGTTDVCNITVTVAKLISYENADILYTNESVTLPVSNTTRAKLRLKTAASYSKSVPGTPSLSTLTSLISGFTVMKEPDSTYKIWYGKYIGDVNYRLYCAISNDGVTWTGNKEIPITGLSSYNSTCSYTPYVIRDGEIYKMWFTGRDSNGENIMYTTSTDGINWNPPSVQIARGGAYPGAAGSPFVLKESDNMYKMWFIGSNTNNGDSSMFYTYSSDGKTWATPSVVISGSVSYGVRVTVNIDGTYTMIYKNRSSYLWQQMTSSDKGLTWKNLTTVDTLVPGVANTGLSAFYQLDESASVRNIWFHKYSDMKLMRMPYINDGVTGDTIEADVETHELNSLSTDILNNTQYDWSAPVVCMTHGTYSGVAETLGYTHATVVKDSDILYKMWVSGVAATVVSSPLLYMTSIDGKTWTSVPVKITLANASTNCYYAPTVLKRDGGMYDMWLLGRGTAESVFTGLYYCSSQDGINWNTPVKVMALNGSIKDFGTKSIVRRNGIYRMWMQVNSAQGTGISIMYYESLDGQNWSSGVPMLIPGNGFNAQNVCIKVAVDVNGTFIGRIGVTVNSVTVTYMSFSRDGINWTVPVKDTSVGGTTYDTTVYAPCEVMVDGNTIRSWLVGSNSGGMNTIEYSERLLDQNIVTDNGDYLMRVKQSPRVPKYMYGFNNSVLNHDILKYNGMYYLFFTKNTGSGYKIQLATSTDLKTWSTAVDVAVPGTDATYKYGCSSPTVIRDGNVFRVYFQAFDSGKTGGVIYTVSSQDGIVWNTPTKVIDVNASVECSKYAVKPCVILDGSTYKMWFLGHDGTNLSVLYTTSTDNSTWTAPTKQMSLGTIGTAQLFDGTMYTSVYKKDTGFRMFLNTGTANVFMDSTDGQTWGTSKVAYKYPNDLLGYNGQSTFRILQDDTDVKMVFLDFDSTNAGTIVYREYDDSSNDFVEASSVEVQVLGDSYYKQTFIDNPAGLTIASDISVIKVGNRSYRGWFSYTNSAGTAASMYTATSTNGIDWENFVKCFDKSTTSDVLLKNYFRKQTVIKDGGLYKMWLSTLPTANGTGYTISYMTSADGITWNAATACTSLGDTTQNILSNIVKDGNVYKAWLHVSGKSSISYYESNDGLTWTLGKADVIKVGDIGASYTTLFLDRVLKIGNEFVAYVSASSSSIPQVNYRLKSSDGKTWYANGVVNIAAKSFYGNKSKMAYRQEFFVEGNKMVAMYGVDRFDGNIDNCICAIYTEDGLVFGKDCDNNVIINSVTITKASNDSNQNTVEFETVSRVPFYNFNIGDRFRVDFKGDNEYINAANANKLKLEVFGASGANQSSFTGGKGGYTYGVLDTSARKKIVAVIGGIGGYDKSSYGFNGGGTILDSSLKYYHGGGATDIRTSRNDLYRRIIVAGGGGSADASDGSVSSGHSGGNGGGWVGTDGVGTNIGKGGTQTSGGSTSLTNLTGFIAGIFGIGSRNNVATADNATYYGAGGGGYYGAGNGSQGAGGGSSYAAGNANCPGAHPEGLALATSGTQSGVNTGNGYAIISVLNIEGSDGSKRTLNGSGPITWNDTMDATGIADMVGNLNQMVTGLKVVNKVIYVIKDNDAAISTKDLSPTSPDWRMVDASGNYIASGTGIAFNYTADFSAVDISAIALTASPYLAKALGIAPADATTGTGFINGGISSEFFPIRGGYYGSGNTAGMFNLSLATKFLDALPHTGFRIAYYKF